MQNSLVGLLAVAFVTIGTLALAFGDLVGTEERITFRAEMWPIVIFWRQKAASTTALC
ncbi:MAG: hypothetical protein HC915_07560 [Anaerolineae bacterium]|nr:hypothetical protein [Anaerolineae bacterium]